MAFSATSNASSITITASGGETYCYACRPTDTNITQYIPGFGGETGATSASFSILGGIKYTYNVSIDGSWGSAKTITPAAPSFSIGVRTTTSIKLHIIKNNWTTANIYVNEILIDSTTRSTYTIEGLTSNTSYKIYIIFSGTWEGYSGSTADQSVDFTYTTSQQDATTLAPTLAWNDKPYETSAGKIKFSYKNGTAPYIIQCYTTVGETACGYMGDSLSGITKTTYTIDELPPGGYTYTVKVIDSLNNSISATIDIDAPIYTITQENESGLTVQIKNMGNYDDVSVTMKNSSGTSLGTWAPTDTGTYTFKLDPDSQLGTYLFYFTFTGTFNSDNIPYTDTVKQVFALLDYYTIYLKHDGSFNALNIYYKNENNTTTLFEVTSSLQLIYVYKNTTITLEGYKLNNYYKLPLYIGSNVFYNNDSINGYAPSKSGSHIISAKSYLTPKINTPSEDDITAIDAQLTVSNIDEAYQGNTAIVKLTFNDVNLSNTISIDSAIETIKLPSVFNSTNYSQLIYNTKHTFEIILQSSNGNTTLEYEFTTDNAYLAIINLINIDKITVNSSIDGNKLMSSGETIQVVPNENIKFLTTNIDFGTNTSNSLNWNYTYPIHCDTTTVFKADGSASTVEYKVDSNNKTFTLKAAPAPWSWTQNYLDNVLKKGVPTTEFKYTEWNRLMHCLDTWYKYAEKGNSINGTFMSSTDKILTKTRYDNAYNGLISIFTNTDDILSTTTQNKTVVTADNLKNFGNIIKYDNYSP